MLRGFLKLWRKSQDSEVFAHAGLWRFWSWILMRVAWRPRVVKVRVGRGWASVSLAPGEMLFGRHSAAERLGEKPSTLRRWLGQLREMGMIGVRPLGFASVVSVVNWHLYQADADAIMATQLQERDAHADFSQPSTRGPARRRPCVNAPNDAESSQPSTPDTTGRDARSKACTTAQRPESANRQTGASDRTGHKSRQPSSRKAATKKKLLQEEQKNNNPRARARAPIHGVEIPDAVELFLSENKRRTRQIRAMLTHSGHKHGAEVVRRVLHELDCQLDEGYRIKKPAAFVRMLLKKHEDIVIAERRDDGDTLREALGP